jgi:hypothetical protein
MFRLSFAALLLSSALLSFGPSDDVPKKFQSCRVTKPNGKVAPGQTPTTMTGQWYGNGDMWTMLWYDGTVVIGPGRAQR